VNLKGDRPSIHEALQRLDRELEVARREGTALVKFIHGYGSTGAGGDIRIAVQRRLCDLAKAGQIRSCIFGENWSKSDERTWDLLKVNPELKTDRHLAAAIEGSRSPSFKIVILYVAP